jgi:hypothetical protein
MGVRRGINILGLVLWQTEEFTITYFGIQTFSTFSIINPPGVEKYLLNNGRNILHPSEKLIVELETFSPIVF